MGRQRANVEQPVSGAQIPKDMRPTQPPLHLAGLFVGSTDICPPAIIGSKMTCRAFVPLLVALITVAADDVTPKFDVHVAERFAKLALTCVEKEYPNKISHVLNSDS